MSIPHYEYHDSAFDLSLHLTSIRYR